MIIFTLIAGSSIYAQNGVLKANARPQPKTISEDNYKAHADGWMVDMEKAYNESKKTGKPIMANFTSPKLFNIPIIPINF